MNLVSEVSTKPEIGFLNNPENLNFENFEDVSQFLKRVFMISIEPIYRNVNRRILILSEKQIYIG